MIVPYLSYIYIYICVSCKAGFGAPNPNRESFDDDNNYFCFRYRQTLRKQPPQFYTALPQKSKAFVFGMLRGKTRENELEEEIVLEILREGRGDREEKGEREEWNQHVGWHRTETVGKRHEADNPLTTYGKLKDRHKHPAHFDRHKAKDSRDESPLRLGRHDRIDFPKKVESDGHSVNTFILSSPSIFHWIMPLIFLLGVVVVVFWNGGRIRRNLKRHKIRNRNMKGRTL